MNKLNPLRKHLLNTVAKDGVCMSAAKLHDLKRRFPFAIEVMGHTIYGVKQRFGFFRITKLINIFHELFPSEPSSRPRWSASKVCTKSQSM